MNWFTVFAEALFDVLISLWCLLFHRRWHWPFERKSCGVRLMECRKCGWTWLKFH